MRIDPRTIEDAAKELYIRALKILPDDVKQGFETLAAREIQEMNGAAALFLADGEH